VSLLTEERAKKLPGKGGPEEERKRRVKRGREMYSLGRTKLGQTYINNEERK